MGVEHMYQAPSSAPPPTARVSKPPNARRSASLADEPPTHDNATTTTATAAGLAAATHLANGFETPPPSSTYDGHFSASRDIDESGSNETHALTGKRRTSPDHIGNTSGSRAAAATSSRPRRPDRAVYVPRARRSQTTPPSPSNADTTTTVADTIGANSATSIASTIHTVKPSAAIVAATSSSSRQNTPTDNHCDICSEADCSCPPPLLRSTSSHGQVVAIRVPTANTSIAHIQPQPSVCDTDADAGRTNPALDDIQHIMQRRNRANNSASPTGGGVGLRIEDAAARTVDRLDKGGDKGGDKDERELRRASKEINRSNRRIIKQTFTSDVLEITDPIEKSSGPISSTPPVAADPTIAPQSPATIVRSPVPAAVSVDPETDDWESMFDDNGDCLDPKLIDEITASVGKVTIEKPKSDYKNFHTKQALLSSEEFPHVLEISGFPVEFKTPDLMMLFAAHKGTGFDIKWVDDTHALAVFSSSKIAAEVLSTSHPFVLLKPLTEATAESRLRAKKCAASLQPFRQRPETCAALARRLVTGALGVRLKTSSEERENERRVLREAKERKLLAAKQRDEVWES